MTDSPAQKSKPLSKTAPLPSEAPQTKQKVPLRFILVVPYVVQLAAAVGLVGWLSFTQGQKAVEKVAAQQRIEIARHISDYLDNILAEPTQINQINLAVTEIGALKFSDSDRLGRLFHRQLQIFPHIGYINYASEQKDFIGAERQNDGKIVLLQSRQDDVTRFLNYQLDPAGRRLNLTETYDPVSIKEEGWYADAVKAGKPVWSSIYQWQHRPEVLSISASIPIYDRSKTLKGVLGADLILSQIGEFLHNLKMTPRAKAVVLERNGMLIANSDREPPYLNRNGQITRKPAAASQNPLMRSSAKVLQMHAAPLSAVQSHQQLTFQFNQETQYIQLFPWKDAAGLDWLVMIIIPASDLMGEMYSNMAYTAVLSLAAIAVAVISGLYTSHKIVSAVRRLGWASQAIAAGQLDHHAIVPSRIREMSQLGIIFNQMANQLRSAFEHLEIRVVERTISLQEAEDALRASEQKLRRQNEALIQLTKNRAVSQGLLQEALQDIATTAADLFAIDRVSVWFYTAESARLDCALLHDCGTSTQSLELSLSQADCPTFFKTLTTEPWIAASDVAKETRLAEIAPYLEPNHIQAFLSAAISVSNQFLGMLCLEHRHGFRDWSFEEEGFARSLADLIVLAVEARDRKQAELALSQAKELAESANRAKSQFLSNMSHELRTPLNAVIGFTQVLQRDASLNPDQQDYINIINRSGEHLLGLINDVLEMSKIESGRMSLEENDFDLSRLLNTVESMFRLKAREKGIELTMECDNQVPCYLHSDEGKLRQVLINLMGNAIKFTQNGSVTVRLSSQERPVQENLANPSTLLRVEVEDTGSGIAPGEMDLLFQAFRQTESGRQSQQGTGLGLSISHKFVALMGGQLQVQSAIGKGTVFSFQVAVQRLESLEIEGDRKVPRIIGIAPHQPTYRILIVDDQRENRLILVKLLTPLGFEVAEAQNGQEAIELNNTWQPHLIFMDMRMPIMDGYEATQRIKDQRILGRPAIVALTASAFEEERNLILHTGCDDFVAKPFRAALLLAKIAEHTGVEFIYEAASPMLSPALKNGDASAADIAAVDVASLVDQMPLNWQQAVYQAAIRGDDDVLLQLVTELPEVDHPAVATLINWVNNFQFEPIMKLTQDRH